MPLVSRIRPRIYACLSVAAISAALGAGYSYAGDGRPLYGAVAGLIIGASLVSFELFLVQAPAGAWLRRLPMLVFIAITTLAWALLVLLSVFVIAPWVLGVTIYPDDLHMGELRRDITFAFAIAMLTGFMLRIESLVGGRVLLNFLIGHYNRPQREYRVFMVLDLTGSTRLSETLGDVRVQELIGQFFFDIARPIADHGGETYRYIGDEVVVSWPMKMAVKDGRCVQCVFDIKDLVAERADAYREEFGVVPEFRVGLHGGPVVVSEVGDDRRAIVYFGETFSISEALQGACKQVRHPFLISADLLDRLKLGDDVQRERFPSIELFPDGTTMDVYALSRAAGEGAPQGVPAR
jgi:class 3 adenylate cyclase